MVKRKTIKLKNSNYSLQRGITHNSKYYMFVVNKSFEGDFEKQPGK